MGMDMSQGHTHDIRLQDLGSQQETLTTSHLSFLFFHSLL